MSTHPNTTLQDLLNQTDIPINSKPNDDVHVTSVVDDSRGIQPGALFVAIRGVTVDGHEFVDQAIKRGASAVVVDQQYRGQCSVPCVVVPDTRNALAQLSATHVGLSRVQGEDDLAIIGVTGTNGKSTTVHLARQLLGENKVATLGTIGYDLIGRKIDAHWTTPPACTLASLLMEAHQHGADTAVMEVSSHALAQRRTAGIRFHAGVFTNLSGDHLDYHNERQSYVRAKKLLFDELRADAHAVVNVDDVHTQQMLQDCQAQVLTYGIDDDADVRAQKLSCTIHGSTFDVSHRASSHQVTMPLIGKHNVYNALAAISIGLTLNQDLETMIAALTTIENARGRLQPAGRAGLPFSVFVDYAHTDDALANVLTTLRPLTQGRLWCLFGCGGDRDRSKRPRMAKASGLHADKIVVTTDNPRTENALTIIDDIMDGFDDTMKDHVTVEPDRRCAIKYCIEHAGEGDVVLIGGKGHETYQLIGTERLDFDDVKIVHELTHSSSLGAP